MGNAKMKEQASNNSIGKDLKGRLERFVKKLEAGPPEKATEFLTVRRVKLDLKPKSFSATEVRDLREALLVSQAVFAAFLGIGLSTLQDWEQGHTEPKGPACRLLDEMSNNLDVWRKKIHSAATATSE